METRTRHSVPNLIFVIFSPKMYFWAQFFSTWKRVNCGKKCINFAYMATFSTSHTCHMWRISDFSTSVMWRHLKFLHMWRNFQFPHNCHTWKAEISPHDNFFSTNIIRDIRDKYQVWGGWVWGCTTRSWADLVVSFFLWQHPLRYKASWDGLATQNGPTESVLWLALADLQSGTFAILLQPGTRPVCFYWV